MSKTHDRTFGVSTVGHGVECLGHVGKMVLDNEKDKQGVNLIWGR